MDMHRERGITHVARSRYYRPHEAAELVGLAPSRVRRYVRIGLIRVEAMEGREPLLGAPELERLRKIRRLTTDLGLNLSAVEVVLRLLDEIDVLRGEIEQARLTTAARPSSRLVPPASRDPGAGDAGS